MVNEVTGQPVAGADVRIMGTARVARSGNDGAFAITSAPAGVLTIEALRAGVGSAIISDVIRLSDHEKTVRLLLSKNPSRLSVVAVGNAGE